mmetsp:Transcript_38837/g.37181  ORF Transcript_38837/g.37181 Transcript_38837/m.37181 type:complete len:246 (+) Transcript_38837:133-870(+)
MEQREDLVVEGNHSMSLQDVLDLSLGYLLLTLPSPEKFKSLLHIEILSFEEPLFQVFTVLFYFYSLLKDYPDISKQLLIHFILAQSKRDALVEFVLKLEFLRHKHLNHISVGQEPISIGVISFHQQECFLLRQLHIVGGESLIDVVDSEVLPILLALREDPVGLNWVEAPVLDNKVLPVDLQFPLQPQLLLQDPYEQLLFILRHRRLVPSPHHAIFVPSLLFFLRVHLLLLDGGREGSGLLHFLA